jgi:hypothetical protein
LTLALVLPSGIFIRYEQGNRYCIDMLTSWTMLQGGKT